MDQRLKIGIVCVCLNQPYWEFAKNMIEGTRKHFLTNHDVEVMLWSDMPPEVNYGATVFPTESIDWPYPTLLRYTLFLQQEEYLRKFDYLFYIDIDMLIVGDIGEEILGDGLTGAQHPMYALRPGLYFPLEPNPDSTAYIPVPKHYFAGGFQGGKTADFLEAMKVMKRNIDADFVRNYIARWNDESHWNRYLFDHPPAVVLSPSYVYPDSLIEEYYKKIWGRDYEPKIITLTKKFTVTKEAGDLLRKELTTL